MKKIVLFIKIPSTNPYKEVAMDKFLQNLHSILPNNAQISLEMVSIEQFLRFYIVTNLDHKRLVESQLYAQYPEAEIEEVKDYLPDSYENVAIARIDFKYSSIFTIRVYPELEENFLKILSSVLSKTDQQEQAFFQLALKRVGSSVFDRGICGTYTKFFGKPPTESSASKFSQELYMGKFRIAFLAKDKTTANKKIAILVNLLKSVKGEHNELKKRNFLVPKNLSYLFRTRNITQGDYWSTLELATVYHFPYVGGLVSNIVQTTSKKAPASDILPTQDNVKSNEVSFIGQTNYRNEKKVFGIKRID